MMAEAILGPLRAIDVQRHDIGNVELDLVMRPVQHCVYPGVCLSPRRAVTTRYGEALDVITLPGASRPPAYYVVRTGSAECPNRTT